MNASIPPPLPSASPATPSPRSGAQGFVTVLAWITLVLGGLGVAYGALQMALSGLMSSDAYLQLLTPAGSAPLPPLMHWMLTHYFETGLFEVIASVLLGWLGWGLLKRREWARLTFIAYLALGTLMTFGGIWYLPAMMDASLSMQASLMAPGEGMPPELEGFRKLMLVFSVVVALVFTALHGGIIWKLCTAGVRVQFQRRA
jgi:hypothetical protein